MQRSICFCDILSRKNTFCVQAETMSQLRWAQTDRQVEVITSGVRVKYPISATANSCYCGGRFITSWCLKRFWGSWKSGFVTSRITAAKIFHLQDQRCLQDRAAETNTREPGQHFQVFYQITSGLLQVNGIIHQHNTCCTRGPPYNSNVFQSLATYLAFLVSVAKAAQCSLTPR